MDWRPFVDSLSGLPWLSLLSGGAAGAVITHYYSLGRQRTELTFKVLEQFFKNYQELATAKTSLADGNVQRQTPSYNQVVALGDWFEIVALFYRQDWIHRKTVERSGIINEARKFRELAATNAALKPAVAEWREMAGLP
jgi:hypothetical protein